MSTLEEIIMDQLMESMKPGELLVPCNIYPIYDSLPQNRMRGIAPPWNREFVIESKVEKMNMEKTKTGFTFSMSLPEATREAIMKLGEESDSYTICVEEKYGHYIPVVEIKRVENCPKELFNKVLKQLMEHE